MRGEADGGVNFRRKSFIQFDVIGNNRFIPVNHPAGDALSRLEAVGGDLFVLAAQGDGEKKLAGIFVNQQQRAGFHIQRVVDARHGSLNNFIDVQAGGDGLGDQV